MRSVPSNEHCGQYGGVGSRDCVTTMVVTHPVVGVPASNGWAMAVATRRAARIMLKAWERAIVRGVFFSSLF